MLKADLHIHTREDPYDSYRIKYSPKELIDYAASLGYKVLSITNHDMVCYNKELAHYAKGKGILLIPGIEKTIKRKHVLIYNITQEQADKVKGFEDLQEVRNKGGVVVAAHPYFFIPCSLGKELIENIDVFDAVEYSSFCTVLVNFNKKAVKIAERYKKPIIGNSDTHNLLTLGYTYSLIDSKQDVDSVLDAIKKNRIELKTSYASHFCFLKTALTLSIAPFRRLMHNLYVGFKKKVL